MKSFLKSAQRISKDRRRLIIFLFLWRIPSAIIPVITIPIAVPLTLFQIFLMLYLNTRSIVKTGLMLLAVPFSAIGAVWLLNLLICNMSIGVWVGLNALLGVDVVTHMAAPMIGGILTSFLLELLVYPAIYEICKWHFEIKKQL